MFSHRFLHFISINCDRRLFHLSRTCLWDISKTPELDTTYLCDPQNIPEIESNITSRKGVGDIQLVHQTNNKLQTLSTSDSLYESTKLELTSQLLQIPNKTHPTVAHYGSEPKVVRQVGEKKPPTISTRQFQEITKKLKLLRTDQLGNLSGNKSYYLIGQMAELEQALIRYIVNNLIRHKFQLISVPDILHRDIVEACGMNTRGTRTQVYSLDHKLHGSDLCLSGTSEIALAGYLANKTLLPEKLPLKLAAVSRCYRAETSNLQEERGIYRVHEFTKVEMFAVTAPQQSEEMLEEIRGLQEAWFESLGLCFRVLDMPPHELGAQAYRKYDVEAWMAGRQMFGEISSCSNCLDYQSRRLGIKYQVGEDVSFVHTLNGTACAIPRLLIALVESGQNSNGTIEIPEPLRCYMGGKAVIGKQRKVPELRLIKNKK